MGENRMRNSRTWVLPSLIPGRAWALGVHGLCHLPPEVTLCFRFTALVPKQLHFETCTRTLGVRVRRQDKLEFVKIPLEDFCFVRAVLLFWWDGSIKQALMLLLLLLIGENLLWITILKGITLWWLV